METAIVTMIKNEVILPELLVLIRTYELSV